MRSLPVALAACALSFQSACLPLKEVGDKGGPTSETDMEAADTDAASGSDSDGNVDSPPTDSDPGESDTDISAGDTDSAAVSVDTAPDTDLPVGPNQAPTVGSPVITPSPAYNSSVLGCVAAAADPDGTRPRVTYAWLNESSGVDLGAGATRTLTPALALPGESVRCTATATDGLLSATSSEVVVLANRPPTVATPTLGPIPMFNTTTVTCGATASDPDGTTPTLGYAWTNVTKGMSLGAGASLALDFALASPGDTLRCAATAADATLTTVSEASAVIGDRPPAMSVPSISPTPAYNTTTLTCSATSSDPDGAATSVTYAWTNVTRGTSLGSGGAVSLTTANSAPGETIRCAATASDGVQSTVLSATTALDDREPVLGTPTILPYATTLTTTVTCSAVASDPDGTTPSLSYAWTDETRGTALGTAASLTLSPAIVSDGDRVRCVVTATDGVKSASSGAALTVGSTNRPPAIGAPTVFPNPPWNTHTVTCAATASDPDGTTPTVGYTWTNVTRGTSLGSGASTTLTTFTALPGETVRCDATASDGVLTASSSLGVIVANRAPTLGRHTISPALASVTSTLTCSGTSSDFDGTTPVVTYAWTNETKGTSLGTGSTMTLSAASAAVRDTIRCTATASDGSLNSNSTYAQLTVAGGVPTVLGTWKSIPAGTFTMGCVVGRDDVGITCLSNEVPAHSVTLTRGFWMLRSEVTQGMWSSLMGNSPSYFTSCGASCPQDSVTWWDALAFANAASAAEGLSACYALTQCAGVAGAGLSCGSARINSQSGSPYDCEGYRLPTEAEWEYAARGGESFAYAGSAVVADVAWYQSNSSWKTHPACSKLANGFGLCDMSGNLAEWTWEARTTYPTSAQSDPVGYGGGQAVIRGGTWAYGAHVSRVAWRDSALVDTPDWASGFRLVRTVP